MNSEPMPTLFVSHGAPSFALEPGQLGPNLTRIGRTLARPTAVLVVSPHWMSADAQVMTAANPKTIHDFGGFDPALYEFHYPAPGAPQVAHAVMALLQGRGWPVATNEQRGLDHGSWVPLLHLYPEADVPVFQVSMPFGLDADSAYAFGQALAPLREQGVLVVGSGSLTHNLHEFRGAAQGAEAVYVREFAAWMRRTLTAQDHELLRQTMALAPHAHRAHPTTEHLLPLMVAAGAAGPKAPLTVIEGGITHGVLAMDSYAFGHLGTSH